jgi:hypothetical protein
MLSHGQSESLPGFDPGDRTSGREHSMSVFAVVFVHDVGEVSVFEKKDEPTARKDIESYQQAGVKLTLEIVEAANETAAWRKAKALNKTWQYQEVPDPLSRYVVYRMGKHVVEKI